MKEMEFTVSFIKNGIGYVATADFRHIGLTELDICRVMFGPGIKAEELNGCINSFGANARINVDEAIARASGHFVHKSFVQVKANDLSRFIIERYADNGPEPSYTERYWIKRILNEKAIIDAWKLAGFPLEWNSQP
jgi:hypothetical protein